MSDSRLDIRRDKYREWKAQHLLDLADACEKCLHHNPYTCPFYDPSEESWNFEQCLVDQN